jgi:aminomethyltransferase
MQVSQFTAGETGAASAGAEGETAPETLRRKDRGEFSTLESGVRRREPGASTEGRNLLLSASARGRPGLWRRGNLSGQGTEGARGNGAIRDRAAFSRPEPLVNLSAALARLPLDSLHRRLGARMAPFSGYDMPLHYASGAIAEHLHTREKAGLFDVSHMGQAILSGAGAARQLERLTGADLLSLAPGRTRYALLLSAEGGVLDDLLVTRVPGREERLLLVVNAARKAHDFAVIAANCPSLGLHILADRALLALQGPRAAAVLEPILPGAADMAFMAWRAFDVDGAGFCVSRSGYTGEDGFEISAPVAAAEAFATRLLEQEDVAPIGLGARDSLRLEAGLCLYGQDIDETTDPVEAGLAWTIGRRRRAEGGFPGCERIRAQIAGGPSRLRVGLAVEGKAPVRAGAELYAPDGRSVGRVTSGGFSPSLSRPIAMGYVAAQFAAPGARLETQLRERRVEMTVSPLPFVAHRYFRGGNTEKGGA